MRYLIDTNIFVYMASDPEYLNRDIDAIIQEPETLLYISAESVRELIVAYRNKGLCSKRWKSAEAMIVAIEKEFYVKILPLKKEHMQTYAHMEINEAQGHKDPSDHVIIAHAITEHLPLISSETCANVSSIGTKLVPYRTIPALSPRAAFTACPASSALYRRLPLPSSAPVFWVTLLFIT